MRSAHQSSDQVDSGSHRLLTVPFDGLPPPYPYTPMVAQYHTEGVLLARLRALGGDVHRPYEVGSVVQDVDGVTVTMSTGETLRSSKDTVRGGFDAGPLTHE